MGLDLTAGDVGALEGRTEGWIAALQLAALSMQGRDDVARFIESFTGGDRFVVDYLAEEVLERQSEDVRSFLLQTAILHRLTGALCDAVTGGRGGKATLEMLAPYGSLSPNGRHRPSGLSALERTPARPDRWPGRHPHLPLTFGGDDGGMGPRVLLAEDDRAIRESLVLALELEGHEVEAVTDGGHALESIMAREPDLIVLDWMMPGVDGLSVCRRVRSGGSAVPILMLTARTEISDRVSGLDAGADDYLAKPFSLDELLARVRALIRRSGSEASDRRIRVADLLVDPAARRAWRGPRELQLTRTEFDLLLTFVRNAGAVCTHSAIYSSAWNYDFGPDSKTLAVYVGYLRRKLEEGGERRLIHTVRGVGYTLRAP